MRDCLVGIRKRLRGTRGLAGIALLCVLTSYYYAFLFLPASPAKSNVAPDLYPAWFASRAVLIEHQDPYAPEITHQIQQVMYHDGEPEARHYGNEHRFAYPLYAVLLFAPVDVLPFPVAQTVVLVASLVLTAVATLVWIPRRAPPATQFLCIAFVLAAPPVAWGMQLRQPSLLFAALLAAIVAAVRKERLVLAGVLGAMATAKPQLAIAVLLPLLVWALADWRGRKRFVIALALTECSLLGASEWMCPGWLAHWLLTIRAYAGYAGARPLIQLLPGTYAPLIGSLLLLTGVGVASWRWRNADPQLPIGFSVAVFCVLLPFQVYNEIMLAPAVFWILLRGASPKDTLLSLLRSGMIGLLGAGWCATVFLAAGQLTSPAFTRALWALPFVVAWVFPLVPLFWMMTALHMSRCASAELETASRRVPDAGPFSLPLPHDPSTSRDRVCQF